MNKDTSIKVKPAWKKKQRPQLGDMVKLGRTGRAIKVENDIHFGIVVKNEPTKEN